jgi:hypothetical protein
MTIAARRPAAPVGGWRQGPSFLTKDFYFHKNEVATRSENSRKVCQDGFKF